MEAGTLVEWLVKPGDTVKRGDIMAVVETQKGAIEVEIFEDGRVEALLVEPGATVPVGTVLARLEGAGAAPPVTAPPPAERPAKEEHRVRASPAARALAHELGVALESVRGTGPSGAITREDVANAAKAPAPRRAGMRQAIAAAMSRSKREIPHYYLSTRIDLSRALDWLRQHNAPLKPAERLLPLALLLKGVALATKKVPEMNGFYTDGAFRPAGGVHLGVAISLREGGLVVPALHDVDGRSISTSSGASSWTSSSARDADSSASSELADATLTVTSLGNRGVEEVFGIIYPPQVAIVGFGKIVETAWAVDGQCVARPTAVGTIAADHRVSDGHRGGLFLAEIGALLQSPEAL